MQKKIRRINDFKFSQTTEHSRKALRQTNPEQENGIFALVSSAISHAFNTRTTMKNYHIRLHFLGGKMVAKFCDCSYNFEQSRLVNEFKKRNPIQSLSFEKLREGEFKKGYHNITEPRSIDRKDSSRQKLIK